MYIYDSYIYNPLPFWLKVLCCVALLATYPSLCFCVLPFVALLGRHPSSAERRRFLAMSFGGAQPTATEQLAITSLSLLFEWAGLTNTKQSASAATTPVTLGARTSLLAFVGAEPNAHYRAIATLSPEDFVAMTTSWTVNGQPPNMMETASARLAHITARRMCKVEPWPTDPNIVQPAPAAQPVAPQQGTNGMTLNTATINCADVLDQAITEQITYIPDVQWLAARAEYVRIMEEEPPEDVDITIEQLSAILHLLQSHRAPYCNYANFGKHGVRLAKRQAMTGLLFDSGGILHKVEMYGPDGINQWNDSYDVMTTGLIMLRAVSRPRLAAYRAHMNYLAAEYGPVVWPLLYQTDVRMRQERMTVLRTRALSKHNAALTAGTPSTFDATKPWDTVWDMSVKFEEALLWWTREFNNRALLVLTRTANLQSCLGGDAVTSSASSTLVPSPAAHAVARASAGTRAKASPQEDLSQRAEDGSYTHNRAGVELCNGFQTGKCTNSSGHKCGSNPSRVHQCAVCLQQRHGTHKCPRNKKGSDSKNKKNKKWNK